MFNNVALDVFIGLVFIFLLYSLLASIIQEFIATRFGFRAKVLEKALLRMLEDGKTTTRFQYGDRLQGFFHLIGLKNLLKGKSIVPWFYAHPLIKYLAEDNYYSKPAYLQADNFSKVMIDLLKGFGYPESQIVQTIHNSIMTGTIYKLPINLVQEGPAAQPPDKANPAIKVLREQNENISSNDLLQFQTVAINKSTALYLKSLWQESGADVDLFRQKLENWFNDTMERATGWYKRYIRVILFFIGLVVAIVFNVDVISIHRILSKDKNAREQLVQLAIKSQDQLASEVERQRKGAPSSDSILRDTYNLVSGDARQANSILGLGRVWKDTCKMCDDSVKEGSDFKTHLESLKNESAKIHDSINFLQLTFDSLRHIRDTIPITLKKKPDALALQTIRLKKRIAEDSIHLLTYLQSPSLREYERMKSFQNRCAFINSQRDGKWFVYAPGQSGNLETLLGWLITALAVTLGAPFWFDLLSKLIKIRGTGAKIDTTDSDDDQTTATAPTSADAKPVSVNVNTNSGEEAVG